MSVSAVTVFKLLSKQVNRRFIEPFYLLKACILFEIAASVSLLSDILDWTEATVTNGNERKKKIGNSDNHLLVTSL